MSDKKFIIGLTGLIASGKDTVAEVFSQHNYYIIDVDKIGHQVLNSNPALIKENFGDQVIDFNGTVDRKSLGNIVFNDYNKLELLNRLIHPILSEEVLKIAYKTPYQKLLFNAALLFKLNLEKKCNKVIFIDSTAESILERLVKRNNITYLEAISRLKSQENIKNTILFSDYILNNDGSITDLITKTKKLIHQIEIEGRYGN